MKMKMSTKRLIRLLTVLCIALLVGYMFYVIQNYMNHGLNENGLNNWYNVVIKPKGNMTNTQFEESEAVLEYFTEIAEKASLTSAVLPRPDIVSRDLSLQFKERATGFLADRLVTEIDLPTWQVSGIILYLAEQKQPDATRALVRFAADERHEPWLEMTMTAIKAINDPALSDKIRSERMRAEAMKKPFPRTLAELEV